MKKTISSLLLAMAALPMLAQQIATTKTTVDCGISSYEQAVTAEFQLENTGNKSLNINAVRVSCGCLAAEYPKTTIAAGEKFIVRLTYDGRQMGRYVKSAGIFSNATDEPFYVTMTGVVRSGVSDNSTTYPYKIGNLRVDKRDVEFDNVNKGDAPTAEIYIVNEGTESLTPNLMHMPSYITAIAMPETLRPGQRGRIMMTLNSELLRDYGLTQTTVYLANTLGDKTSEDNEINVSAVLLPDFSNITDNTRQYAPQMTLSQESIDVSFGNKKKISSKIVITNNGRTTLDISALQLFTRGLSVKLNKRIINPGEKATLKITAMRDELKQVRTKPRILMITNDPSRPKVVIDVNVK